MRSVLHVLPHPGGGGETYVDTLERMDGFEFERLYLAPGPQPREALRTLPRTAVAVNREARAHDLVHVHGEVASGLALPSLALRPSVVTLNGLHLLRRLAGPRRLAAVANLRLVVRAASRTICVSNAERQQASSALGPKAAANLLVIPNGVDVPALPTLEELARARAGLGLAPSTVAAAWIGTVEERKDPLLAARAAIEVVRIGVPFTLLVVGDGPLRPALEDLSIRNGNAVRVLGFRRDVRAVLAAADLFVLSSHREGLPYALLEAMAMGLPPVVLNEPGTAEGVGDAGRVVSSNGPAAFADALAALATNEAERLELGRRARARVESRYLADEMVAQTRTAYEAVLERRDG